MDKDAVIAEFKAADALQEGHFLLSSGLHSPIYLQCARVLMDPARAHRLCAALADRVRAAGIEAEMVVSPAMGGVIVGYEMARQLQLPSIFAERVDGRFALRRGFDIPDGTRVLIVEDVVTTGLSSRECIDCAVDAGAEVIAEACLVDRSGGEVDVGVPLISLLPMKVPSYRDGELPAELAAIPAVKPGSRELKKD